MRVLYLDSDGPLGGASRSLFEVVRPLSAAEVDPYFVAGFLSRTTQEREAATGGGTVIRSTIRKTRIPRITLPEQQRYGAAFKRLARWSADVDTVWRTGRDAVGWAVRGLTAGALDPDPGSDR